MSYGVDYLHSHSGLERSLEFPKNTVLVDERYREVFEDGWTPVEDFKHEGVKYLKVPILAFIEHHGVFKNLDV